MEGRDEKGRFAKGHKIAIGRPPKVRTIPDILKKIGEEKESGIKKLDIVMNKVFDMAIKGTPWAVQFIADRTEGKAIERVADVTDEWKELIKKCGIPD